MAKIIIELDDSNADNREELNRHVKSLDMASMLFEITRNGRRRFENISDNRHNVGEQNIEGYDDAVEEIFNWISEVADENGIIIEDLIS